MAGSDFIIRNASAMPLATGGLPQMGGALINWFVPLTFGVVTKKLVNFEVTEVMDETTFMGVVQPLDKRRLLLKPEGQRSWTWIMMHSVPTLTLDVDDVVIFMGKQTRVMARNNYKLYGYIEYELVQDWTGAGPFLDAPTIISGNVVTNLPVNVISAGSFNSNYPNLISGGAPS